jgi:DNA-binding response OmpR family regulator
MHLLLIEPDSLLATTYEKALQRAGHTVAVAHNAQAAINAADAQRPELVILELQLIEHNGIEFLYEFRSYPEWQRIPVIVHSWVPLDTRTSKSLEESLYVTAYHYKPQTTLRHLLASVREHTVSAI